jgi:integrase
VNERREGRIFARGKKRILWIAWWADGREHRESTKSSDPRVAERKLREKLAAKDKGEVYVPGAHRVTVGRLAEVLREYHEAAETKSRRRVEQCLQHVVEHFGETRRAIKITYASLEGYARSRREQGAAPATVRFELAAFSQAFKVARRRGLLATQPLFPSVSVRNVRTVHFTDAELERLMSELPEYLSPVVKFAAATGWRLMECLNLRWTAIDFNAGTIRLEPGQTKSGRGRVFPFRPFPLLAAVLEEQRQVRWAVERERGVAVTHVFHRSGKPIRDIDDAWRAACRRAELQDRRFHDLRRYAAMRLVRAGVSRSEAMGLLGHETESMFTRYALNDVPALERAVEKLAALDSNLAETSVPSAPLGQKLGQMKDPRP